MITTITAKSIVEWCFGCFIIGGFAGLIIGFAMGRKGE